MISLALTTHPPPNQLKLAFFGQNKYAYGIGGGGVGEGVRASGTGVPACGSP